jgi:DNA-binding NtrC family response regulator
VDSAQTTRMGFPSSKPHRVETSFERRSGVMHRALVLAEEMAKGDDALVLVGEPGAGRRRLAAHVHNASARGNEALVELDLPLFVNGFERRVRDAFRSADRGGVLLSNVEFLPPPLLAVLAQLVTRYGAGASTSAFGRGVRLFVVSAPTALGSPACTFASRLLQHGVAEQFLAELCNERARGEPCMISSGALDSLERYWWPDNVRELREVLRRAVMTVGDGRVVDIAELPRRIRAASEPSSTEDVTLEEVEKRHVLAVLTRLGWHREATARALGISVSTLARRLQGYGLARGHDVRAGD